jgi:aspartyl aminopeptidase
MTKEELFYKPQHCSKIMSDKEVKAADGYCEDYMKFLGSAKTEREISAYFRDLASEKGFFEYKKDAKYKAGDKVFRVNHEKDIILCVFGKKSPAQGVRISAAHIDSPRLDLKPNPLYEDSEMALFKTHYYGGIKKYQWTVIPMSLHGVIIKKDGSKLTVNIGEDDNDPLFCVTDLLPHLGKEQMKRTLSDGVRGEELNLLVGSRPFRGDKESDAVKHNILSILNKKYGITEYDFLCAELEAVPAYKPRDIGFDRSMIGAYGHDDRVCAYPAATAIFDIDVPEYTCVTVLTDKEEIGSEGNTGLSSCYLQYFIEDLAAGAGADARDVFSKTKCLSADVNSAFDPTFPDVMDKNNSSYINRGVVVTKYTGAGGKYDTSDANAEFMGEVRAVLDAKNVIWQIGELGKVDNGGGGTVAKYIAHYNADVVDVGVPVLSMHAPFEIVSKLDVYMAYRAFYEFFAAE